MNEDMRNEWGIRLDPEVVCVCPASPGIEQCTVQYAHAHTRSLPASVFSRKECFGHLLPATGAVLTGCDIDRSVTGHWSANPWLEQQVTGADQS